MNYPRLRPTRRELRRDPGALFDIYASSTTESDWQLVVDALRSTDWPSSYLEDNDAALMPLRVSEVFARRETVSILWQIEPTKGLRINSHFFEDSEIEFDIDPREIISQARLDGMCDFMRILGQALGKPVDVGVESFPGSRPDAVLRYAPEADVMLELWHSRSD